MANIYTAQPFSPEEVKKLTEPDPQPAYAAMAAKCPVHRGPDGTRSILRYEDVVALCKRNDVLGPGASGPTMGGARKLIPLDLDGPEQQKYRRLLDPLFSAKRMAALEPTVRAMADQLIDGFIEKKTAELQADFCQPLPTMVFLRLLGLPVADFEQFVAFKNIILGHLPAAMPLPARMAAIREASARCYAYLGEAVDRRLAEKTPSDDLLGSLAAAEVDGEKLGREQILDIAYLMILAGLDTVASSLACSIARLAREPELRARLVAEPEKWGAAIEELLRFEAPVQRTFRTATSELEVAGETIEAGGFFFVNLATANLDPAVFENPLALDIDRKPNPHLAFGSGFHRCLGIQLARMELKAALEQLHERIPNYRLADGQELAFVGMPRTVNALRIVWDSSEAQTGKPLTGGH